jgi:hypothetical protein
LPNFNLIKEKNYEDDSGCCGSLACPEWCRIRGVCLLRRSGGLLCRYARVLFLICT